MGACPRNSFGGGGGKGGGGGLVVLYVGENLRGREVGETRLKNRLGKPLDEDNLPSPVSRLLPLVFTSFSSFLLPLSSCHFEPEETDESIWPVALKCTCLHPSWCCGRGGWVGALMSRKIEPVPKPSSIRHSSFARFSSTAAPQN